VNEQRVVNTSPLIYLSRAGLLDLLASEAGSIVVPQAVADEIMAWPTADAAQRALRSDPRLTLAAIEPIPSNIAAWDLGLGESAVIAYGAAHGGKTLVLDDLAARRCAASLNLPVRGTLGLVLRAKQRGAIPSARQTLLQLRATGMFLSDAVLEPALRQIGE
jgi:predicted nucleic acid-binding protein